METLGLFMLISGLVTKIRGLLLRESPEVFGFDKFMEMIEIFKFLA